VSALRADRLSSRKHRRLSPHPARATSVDQVGTGDLPL